MMSVKSSVPEAAGCSEPVHVWTDPAAVLVMYSSAGGAGCNWCGAQIRNVCAAIFK